MTLSKIIFAAALLTLLLGCQQDRIVTVPKDLVGVWKTSNPKYADRHFELTETTIYFGTGGDSFTYNSIWKIEEVQNGSHAHYTISYSYMDVPDKLELSFFYDLDRDTIRFENQNQITWKKDRS